MEFVDRLKKAASVLVGNSYSLADQAKAMTAMSQATPKQAAVYNDGQQYSPGIPLNPANSGKPPWQYQYRVGRNLVINPRSEDARLTPFQVLRTLAETHDITAMCWKMMVDQVTGDEWDIVSANKNDRENYEKEIEEVKHFFWKPDKVHLFNDWLKPYLTDVLQIDAGCLYKRRSRNGKLFSLEYVNGETIKPLIDAYGRVPLAPNDAYQQIIYGTPYGSSQAKSLGFSLDDIVYRPRYPRTWTPYGFAPTEQILMKINIALRRDSHLLNYYTAGSTPDGGIYSFDNENMTPDQLEVFASLYNDVMSGNSDERLKLKFLPKGHYTETKKFEYDVKLDEWLARLVAVSFGVNPQAFVMMMNRSTGQLQDQQQTDIGLEPLENYLAEGFTDIIQNDLGYKNLKFKYVDEKKEDAQLSIQRDTAFTDRGIMTIDEVRSMRGLPPLTSLEDGVPPYVKVGNDIILLTEEYIKSKSDAQLQALSMGNVQGGNQQNTEVRIKQASDAAEQSADVPPDKVPVKKPAKAQKAVQDELKQFEKFAIGRLKKKSKREFEPNILSKELVKAVNDALESAETPSDVKTVFNELNDLHKQSDLVAENADKISEVFEELKDEILDNIDDVTDEDYEEQDGDSKKLLLLLLLLGNYDFRESFSPTIESALDSFAKQTIKQAIKEINALGGKSLSADEQKKIVTDIVIKRMDFVIPEIQRVTESKLAADTKKATNKQELTDAINNSYAVSDDRASTISDIEQRTMRNAVRIATAKASDVVYAVLVSDGQELDSPCINANGQIWSLDYAEANLLQHPRCVRNFTYLTKEEAEQRGGIDVE